MRLVMRHLFTLLSVFFIFLLILPASAQDSSIQIERIATDLQNPRGVVVLDDGRLVVAQAGTGFQTLERELRTGSLSVFTDLNADGDFDDAGERTPIVTNIASYNSLTRFGTGHDEVNGIGDVFLMEDGRILYGKDDPAAEITRDGDYRADVAIYMVSPNLQDVTKFIKRFATINAIAHDPRRAQYYLAESGLNRISIFSESGELVKEIELPLLAHGQQPVPTGLAIDPDSGEVLVSLLSGFVRDYYGTDLSFMPGDAQILRVNPLTETVTVEISGLTTAMDVAIDERGNIYTVELTTVWPAANMPDDYELFNPDAPPDAGGYARFTGRISLYPANGGAPIILADDLDQPTNLTYHDGALYVSTGQGTPNRPIIGKNGLTRVTGEIYRITGF